MMLLYELFICLLLWAGLFFLFVGTLGLLRMPDLYTRMHATSKCDTLGRETRLERLIFAAFAGIILYGGLAYSQIIDHVVLPMSSGFGYDVYGLNYVAKSNVWNAQDLGGIAISLGIGAVAFISFSRIDFRLPFSKKLSIEQLLYKPVLNFLLAAFMTVGRVLESVTEGVLLGSVGPVSRVASLTGSFDSSLLPRVGKSILAALLVVREQSYLFVVSKVNQVAQYVQQAEWVVFFTMIKVDYNPRGDELYRRLTLMNLDLCLFIVIVTLVIIFSLHFLTLLVL